MSAGDPQGAEEREALEELRESVRSLETLAERGQAPSRYDSRRLLLALGQVLGEPSGARAEAELLERLRRASSRLGEPWQRAVGEEMQLACSEHVLGVDARYMQHPSFDFDYVLAARERLELRLRAIEHLGVELEPEWSRRVALADALLAARLASCEDAAGP